MSSNKAQLGETEEQRNCLTELVCWVGLTQCLKQPKQVGSIGKNNNNKKKMISYFQLPFFSMSSQIIVERGKAKFSSKLYKGKGD